MDIIKVDCCRNCPFYDGSDREMATCIHTNAPKGAYNAIVSRSHFKPEPIESWCPIKDGTTKVKRDSNDNIISKTKIIITGDISQIDNSDLVRDEYP